ncbi:MAG TPA: hypothetical protein DIC59_04625 [Candidatus Competibacteraceae bacterium]|nr:hypothetical protein [Candidatus Competibacteraceae bacterium]
MTEHSAEKLVRPAHLSIVTGFSEPSISRLAALGKIPPHDLRGNGNGRLWKLSTLRAWNPAIADAVESLLKHPALGSIKIAA